MRDHAADIRALRKQSNAAIAALDPDYVASFLHEDATVAVAGGQVLRGRSANREAFADQMGAPGYGGYVRTPEQVLVHTEPLRATERGNWVGRWQVKGRMQEQRGTYTAEWVLGEIGWLIVAETYR